MPTTTIRLDQQLKARATKAAERSGMTTHAFIVDAIAQTVERAERRDAFHHEAEQRWSEVLAKEETVSWSDLRSYLLGRAAGQTLHKPPARKLSK